MQTQTLEDARRLIAALTDPAALPPCRPMTPTRPCG